MSSLTRHPAGETTRNLRFGLLSALAAVALDGGGCATSGPNHVYLTLDGSAAVHDLGDPASVQHPTAAGDGRVLGLAYDFNTDHLFLRLAPAQVIRVIERPSGKILREMPLPAELRTEDSADLAIRSSDRHLFAAHPDGRSVVELTLLGAFVRRLELPGLDAPIGGLAYDQRQDRLLVLAGQAVQFFTAGGRAAGRVALGSAVRPVSLGYDSDARHFFVPLPEGNLVGEFDADGRLLTSSTTGPVNALDAGPRSFVRVF